MIDFVKKDSCDELTVATEAGILYQMQKEVPLKMLIPAPTFEDNRCACSECPYMKMNTVEKLYECLVNETPEIHIDETIRIPATLALKKMLALSN